MEFYWKQELHKLLEKKPSSSHLFLPLPYLCRLFGDYITTVFRWVQPLSGVSRSSRYCACIEPLHPLRGPLKRYLIKPRHPLWRDVALLPTNCPPHLPFNNSTVSPSDTRPDYHGNGARVEREGLKVCWRKPSSAPWRNTWGPWSEIQPEATRALDMLNTIGSFPRVWFFNTFAVTLARSTEAPPPRPVHHNKICICI